MGAAVAHQARHTLATSLAAGASLQQIKQFLGQVSERMAEYYAKVAPSDLDDVLHHVWVAGPGALNPGELLSSGVTALAREEAEALAMDLNRRSTPAEGGICTYQVVVDGGACPWKRGENCDRFVMTGADLLYWRRKREQWYSIAERAPDDVTADYLHQVFEPTARAIDGLEKALAGLGLLKDALAMDLRRPQDYFHRLWSIGFQASDLATVGETTWDPWRICDGRCGAKDAGRQPGPAAQHRGEAATHRRSAEPDAPRAGNDHLPGRRPAGRSVTHVPLPEHRRQDPDGRRDHRDR
jgi:hypothetical protein